MEVLNKQKIELEGRHSYRLIISKQLDYIQIRRNSDYAKNFYFVRQPNGRFVQTENFISENPNFEYYPEFSKIELVFEGDLCEHKEKLVLQKGKDSLELNSQLFPYQPETIPDKNKISKILFDHAS